jgi:DNA-binding MarR family transcriptional regulator
LDDIPKEAYVALARFREQIRAFLHFSERSARKKGLTPQQHQALLMIKGTEDRNYTTVGELAARLHLKHHSTVGLLDRMERVGLVRRAVNPTDRRYVRIYITPAGEEVLRQLTIEHLDELARIGWDEEASLWELFRGAARPSGAGSGGRPRLTRR